MQKVLIGIGLVVALGGAWWLVAADEEDESGIELAQPEDDDPRRRAARSGGGGGGSYPVRTGDGSLEARVATLEQQVQTLQRQLQGARTGSAFAAARDGGADFDEVAPEDPAFADGVRAVLDEEREAERERWQEARRERWEEHSNEILDELVAEVGVTREHRDVIHNAWTAEAEQIMPLIMSARSGEGSWREIREQVDQVRTETDAQVKELLTAEQYAAYEEKRPRGPGGRGGPGGRRGRDRGGDRGGE